MRSTSSGAAAATGPTISLVFFSFSFFYSRKKAQTTTHTTSVRVRMCVCVKLYPSVPPSGALLYWLREASSFCPVALTLCLSQRVFALTFQGGGRETRAQAGPKGKMCHDKPCQPREHLPTRDGSCAALQISAGEEEEERGNERERERERPPIYLLIDLFRSRPAQARWMSCEGLRV